MAVQEVVLHSVLNKVMCGVEGATAAERARERKNVMITGRRNGSENERKRVRIEQNTQEKANRTNIAWPNTRV